LILKKHLHNVLVNCKPDPKITRITGNNTDINFRTRQVLVKESPHNGGIFSVSRYCDHDTRTFDFSPSYLRLFIIVPLTFHYSDFHHRTFDFTSSKIIFSFHHCDCVISTFHKNIVLLLFCYFDFSPSYFRLFIIEWSFHHRGFAISTFHQLTFDFSSSFRLFNVVVLLFRLFTIVSSCVCVCVCFFVVVSNYVCVTMALTLHRIYLMVISTTIPTSCDRLFYYAKINHSIKTRVVCVSGGGGVHSLP
jgi:hypothetical protein